jgi:hypothetical protein
VGQAGAYTVPGAVIGDGHNILIQSTAFVQGQPIGATVPEPSSVISLGLGAILCGGYLFRQRRRRN